MSDIKEECSRNNANHAMKQSSEKCMDDHSAAPVTPKKVFKPRFPYLWIFGRSGEDESADDASATLNYSNASCQSYNDQALKNGCCEINRSVSNGTLATEDSPPLYYGVSLPSGSCSADDEDPLVFTDKKEALRAVKKFKGARFKVFSKEEDAVSFASQMADEICSTPTPQVTSPQVMENEKSQGIMVEKPSPFRGPKSQEMVKLRKAIESGDEVYVMETVWSNPRYLISSCDTPAIMQEGFRYNGLHVAAKHKQPRMCQLIMETIENPMFMELLYNDDSVESRAKRVEYVVDLYLNTPDKGLCETPLHFASKFGCLEAVEILAFHPKCDKRRKNKYGLEAKEIICERCPSTSPELKKKIEEVFQDHYFVPVLRSDGNSIQPVIGEPYSPDNPRVPYSCSPVTNPVSPLDPSLSVVAVAGPLSPKDAADLYHFWKTPAGTPLNACETSKLSRIRLSDTEKGLERIGRYLAHSMNTHWTEYWPSLNEWCDLSAESGLQKLENHLKELYIQLSRNCFVWSLEDKLESKKMLDSKSSGNFQLDDDLGSSPVLSKTADSSTVSSASSGSSGISQLCHRLEDFHLSDSDNSLLKTSPDMPRVLKSSCDPFQQHVSPLNSPCDEEENAYQVALSVKPLLNPVFGKGNFMNSGTSSTLVFITDSNSSAVDRDSLLNSKPKSSTPKVGDSLNRHHFGQDIDPKTNVVGSSGLIVVKNVVQSVLEVFSEMLMNTGAVVMPHVTLHKFLVEDVLPHVKRLHESIFVSDSEKGIVHCDIALKVYKEIKDSFMYHEIHVITRYLVTYLESKFSSVSSDEEAENSCRKRLFRKPKCLTISNSVLWKQLMCILVFLSTFLSDNECVSDISIIACQCKWGNSERLSPEEISSQNSSRNESFPSVTDSDSSDEEYTTAPSSADNSSGSSTPEEPSTPDEGLEIYVEGSFPSKADADVLRAVENICVDSSRFPHVFRWKHLMSSFDRHVIESWPSPSSKNFHQKNVYSKSRTPCRSYTIFPSDRLCDSDEVFTPFRNKSQVRPLLRHVFNTENLCKKFLALEEKE